MVDRGGKAWGTVEAEFLPDCRLDSSVEEGREGNQWLSPNPPPP